jgi:hypothetical protein
MGCMTASKIQVLKFNLRKNLTIHHYRQCHTHTLDYIYTVESLHELHAYKRLDVGARWQKDEQTCWSRVSPWSYSEHSAQFSTIQHNQHKECYYTVLQQVDMTSVQSQTSFLLTVRAVKCVPCSPTLSCFLSANRPYYARGRLQHRRERLRTRIKTSISMIRLLSTKHGISRRVEYY